MPCGKRSCDKRKDAVHEQAMAKTRPGGRNRSMVFVPRSYGGR